MKRKFIKKPVMAAESFWSPNVTSVEEIRAEIQKAIDAGKTFEDVADYLGQLYTIGILNYKEHNELYRWAEPRCTDGDQHVKDSYIASVVEKHQPEDTKYITFTFDCDDMSIDLYAKGTSSAYEYEDERELDEKAIDKIEAWARRIARQFNTDGKCMELASSLERETEWDWYSGMMLTGGGGPFTYTGFSFHASGEDE